MRELYKNFAIEGRDIGQGQKCFVIAEVGVNHNGNIDTALAMVDAIAEAGADCVKFQTFHADEFISKPNEIYEYVSQGKIVRESQLQMFRRLELKNSDFASLFKRAREKDLIPLSTPTDRQAVNLLESLNIGAFKIGSDDLVYTPFLEYVASRDRPIIISTGMADMEEIDFAIDAITKAGNNRICLLHCVSIYPTPDTSLNLRKIPVMKERFGCPVGFSDHSEGILAAVGSIPMGASVVEKHFTLDKNMPGPDHRFSADPKELADLIIGIRRTEVALGEPNIRPAPGELEMRQIARRSIVAAHDLPVGHVITINDLAYQRPGTGLMPYQTNLLVGREIRVPIAAKECIYLDSLRGKKD